MSGFTVVCEEGEQERAQPTALGGSSAQCNLGGEVLTHTYLWSVGEEV